MSRNALARIVSVLLVALVHLPLHAADRPSQLPPLLRELALTNMGARDWLQRLGARGRGPARERLIAITRTGVIVDSLDGDATHVSLTPGLDRMLAVEMPSLVLVHNHPNGTSLSGDDMSQLEKPAVIAVIAIGHDGSIYAAARGPHFDSGWCGGDRYGELRAVILTALVEDGDAGYRRPFLVSSFSTHLAALALARTGVIEYVATMAPDRRAAYDDRRAIFGRIVVSASSRIATR